MPNILFMAYKFKNLVPLYTKHITYTRFCNSSGHIKHIKNNGLKTFLYTNDRNDSGIPIQNTTMARAELFGAGYKQAQYIEKIREGYLLKNNVIAIDHYPGLPPYIATMDQVEDEKNVLHFYWTHYGISAPLVDISFDSAAERLRGHITKSHNQFDIRLWRQQFWLIGIRYWKDYSGGMILT